MVTGFSVAAGEWPPCEPGPCVTWFPTLVGSLQYVQVVAADYTFLGDTIPSWISSIGGLVATGVAVVAFVQGRRTNAGMKQMAEVVEARQSESLRTGAGSTSSTMSPPSAGDEGEVVAPASRVVWTLTRLSKSEYVVANEGTAAANVHSYGPKGDGFVFRARTALPADIPPGAFLTFLWIKSWQSPSVMSLEIGWTEGEGGTEHHRLLAVT